MAQIGDINVEILVRVNGGDLFSLGEIRVPLKIRDANNPSLVQLDLDSEFGIVADYLRLVFGEDRQEHQE